MSGYSKNTWRQLVRLDDHQWEKIYKMFPWLRSAGKFSAKRYFARINFEQSFNKASLGVRTRMAVAVFKAMGFRPYKTDEILGFETIDSNGGVSEEQAELFFEVLDAMDTTKKKGLFKVRK